MPQLPFVSLFLETSQGNSEATTLPPPPHARRMRQPALGRDPGARPGDCESAAGARGPAGAGLSHNGQVSSPPPPTFPSASRASAVGPPWVPLRDWEGVGREMGGLSARVRSSAVRGFSSVMRRAFEDLPCSVLPSTSSLGNGSRSRGPGVFLPTLSRATFERFPTGLGDPAGPGWCAAAFFSLGKPRRRCPCGPRVQAEVAEQLGFPRSRARAIHSDRVRTSGEV